MKLKRILAAMLMISLLASMTACGDDKDEVEADSSPTASQPSADAPDVDMDMVVYTIGDQTFTMEEYVASYGFNRAMMEANLMQYGMSLDDMLADESVGANYAEQLRMMGTEQLTYLAVMNQKGAEEGITVTEDDIAEQYDMVVSGYEDEDALEADLANMGMTVDVFQTMLKSDILAQQLTEIYLGENGKATPAEADVRAEFDANYLRAKHVLISTVDENYEPLENQDELEALANEIADRAQAGEDFDALIAEYGEDPGMTVAENADGYVFAEGTMVDSFYQGTKALTDNAISEPIQSDYGWHVIQRLPLRDADYENAKATVQNSMVNFETLFTEWAADTTPETDPIIAELTDAQIVALCKELVD